MTDQGGIDFTHEVLTDINNFLARNDGRPDSVRQGRHLEKECVRLVEDILSAALRHGLQLHPSTVARVFLRTSAPDSEGRRRFLDTYDPDGSNEDE